jgi:hypothetical protein
MSHKTGIWNKRKDEDGKWVSYTACGLIIYVPTLIIQSEE